jgi:hypothetical protein
MTIATPKFLTAINNLDGKIYLEKHTTLAKAKLYIESFFDDDYLKCCKNNLENIANNENTKYTNSFQVTDIWNEEEKEWDYSMFEFLVTILPL